MGAAIIEIQLPNQERGKYGITDLGIRRSNKYYYIIIRMFSSKKIQQVWEKGVIVDGYDPSKWRKDFAGAWIRRDLYGTGHEYGWAIDHLRPRAAGGSDDIDNLTPLNSRNNISKADDFPTFVTVITSNGNKNIERRRRWLLQ